MSDQPSIIPSSLSIPLAIFIVCLPFVWWLRQSVFPSKGNPKGLPYVPGPKPLPLIGNLRDFVTKRECETYAEWSKTYGPMIGLNIFGKNLIYINSSEIAHELFDKRSSIYSDRVITPMMRLMGLDDWPLVVLEYGPAWRKHRKIFHSRLHPQAAAEFHPLHVKATTELLYNLMKDPKDYVEHLRYLGGSVLVESTYGFPVKNKQDEFLQLADEAINIFSEIQKPGAFLVEVLPFLRYVPDWMPGAGFKKQAKIWSETFRQLRDVPWNIVKDKMQKGSATNSFATGILEDGQVMKSIGATEYDFKGACATTYGAGTDTMLATLEGFILAMVMNPDVQKEAQKEVSDVVGDKRLPDFDDRESLPYLEALLKEVYRFNPALPLGVPHRVMEDDVYNGYFIPKDTIVFGNGWAMLRDEKIYGPDAHKFRPSRFIENPNLPDPRVTGTFGFGRRVCPGKHLADSLVWLAMASIIATLDLHKANDANGKVIEIIPEYTSGFVYRPLPFASVITPRSQASAALIMKSVQDHGIAT